MLIMSRRYGRVLWWNGRTAALFNLSLTSAVFNKRQVLMTKDDKGSCLTNRHRWFLSQPFQTRLSPLLEVLEDSLPVW